MTPFSGDKHVRERHAQSRYQVNSELNLCDFRSGFPATTPRLVRRAIHGVNLCVRPSAVCYY